MGGRVPHGGQSARWEAECDKGLRARTEVHPMGSRAPDGEQYTWTERVQCTPIGCRALANKHKRGALPLAGTRGAVAAGWTVCGACWGRRRAWGIGADRGACGYVGRPTAHRRAGWIAVRAGGRRERGASTWILAQLVRQ